MNPSEKLILVIGATGSQGGAVANEALKQGFKVRILVRDKGSPKAQALIQKGAEPVVGNLGDQSSLEKAMENVNAVFSVPILQMDTSESDSERKHAFALIQAAKKCGVEQFVHSSVAATSRHTEFPKWGTGYWYENYWTSKWDIEEAVRSAGFSSWTILKPAVFMQNFTEKAYFMYPHLKEGKIKTVTLPDTRIDFIATEDIGAFACAAFANPEKFNGQNIELAAESLTYIEVGKIISDVTGREIKVTTLSFEEAVEQGTHHMMARAEEWNNVVGYNVDIDSLKKYNIKLTTFKEFAEKHKEQL